MREFLITKLVCSVCGSNLQLTQDTKKVAGRYAAGEPTGADMLEQIVVVEPCGKCMKPLDELRAAARLFVHEAKSS